MKEDFYCEEVFSGRVSVKKVKETQNVLAFYHTKPSYDIHVVVAPKAHVVDLFELKDPRVLTEMFEVIRESIIILGLKDYRLITNSGNYQDSKHLHFHIISGNKTND
jgi:histidine triad (HIT) family protein